MSLTFGQLIKKLQNTTLNDLQQEYGFEILETMIRLVKYKQGYQFYQVNLDTLQKTKLDFLNFSVKDNVPVYDILLENEIYQIKNSKSININNKMSIQSLAEKLNVKCVIILDNEFDNWLQQFNLLDFTQENKQIKLKDYQLSYYNQLCELIDKNKVSCLSLPPRFGKTYLIGKFIQEHPEIRVCVLTSYPSECFPVYKKIQAEYNFNFKFESKQYFREEDYEEKTKEFQHFDLFFLDEFHYCGNTELTQKVLKTLDKKICYVSGTPFKLIKLQKLPYISVSKEDFEKINYPQLQIDYVLEKKMQDIYRFQLKEQKSLIKEQVQQTDDQTFVYLETDGNCVEQKDYIEKHLRKDGITNVQIFCEQNKVGGTYEDLMNIFVMNNNMNELLIQQIFRLMNPTTSQKHCFIYNFQQIINIIQFFQKLFSLDFSILEFEKILPRQITLNIDKELIKQYLCQQTVKLTCVNEDNKKYIQSKLLEKLNETILGTTNKVKNQNDKTKLNDFVEKINNIKDEKIHPMILLMERVSTFVVIINYFNQQKKYNEKQQDYLLRELYHQMNVQNKLKLRDIVNGMFSTKLIDKEYDYKLDFICRLFDAENKTQLIYNYYNQFEQLIKSQDKVVLYEQFMQNMCNTTDYEKKQNAEILTPIWLVKEMIQTFQQQVPDFNWQKSKIIEPCCGKGAFLVCLYEHLISLGCSQKEILEEILVFNDINEFNIQICKLLLDPENKYKLQYSNIDALKIDYSQYDLVITNPPYNLGSKSIYLDFVQRFYSSKYQLCLIPFKFNYQQKNNIFKYQNCYMSKQFDSKMFKCVEIVVFYYIHGPNIDSNCLQYQNNNFESKYQIIQNIYKNINYTEVGNIKCYTSSFNNDQQDDNHNYYKMVQYDIQDKFWKVVLIHKIRNKFNWIIVEDNEIFNESFIGYKCDTKQEAIQLQKLLMQDDKQREIKEMSYSSRDINKIQLQLLIK